jgi:hypothetical protein
VPLRRKRDCAKRRPGHPIAGPMGRSLRFRQSRRCRNCRLAASLSKRSAAAIWRIPKFHSHGRIDRWRLRFAHLTIDAGVLQAPCQSGTQQNVVETQTAVAFPTLPHVIPKRVHRFVGMERANGVGPPLREKALIRSARAAAGRRDPMTSSGRCRGPSAQHCSLPPARRALQSRRVQPRGRSSA